MSDIQIFPPAGKDPIAHKFANGTFIPTQAIFEEFEVYTYAPVTIEKSIYYHSSNKLQYFEDTDRYSGTGFNDNERYANIKLQEALKNDRLKKQYYNAYIVNRDIMYDIDSNEDPYEYAKFLYENPVLVDSVIYLSTYINYISPNAYIEQLEECAAYLDELREFYKAKLVQNDIPKINYKNIRKLHQTLINVLEKMDSILYGIEIVYESAKLTDIHAKDHIILQGIDFDNLHVDWDAEESNGYDYPIIGITECKIRNNIILNSTVMQLIVKWSNIGPIISNNYGILGIHFDAVNVGHEPITLPNCGQTVYICAVDTEIDPKHYKEMINFSKKGVTKIFTTDTFANRYLKLNPSTKMSNIPLFFANYGYSNMGSRFEKLKMQFDADAFIISDEPNVLALNYEKKYQTYDDLPRNMMELLAGILSK
jgi:hypothetical protein